MADAAAALAELFSGVHCFGHHPELCSVMRAARRAVSGDHRRAGRAAHLPALISPPRRPLPVIGCRYRWASWTALLPAVASCKCGQEFPVATVSIRGASNADAQRADAGSRQPPAEARIVIQDRLADVVAAKDAELRLARVS